MAERVKYTWTVSSQYLRGARGITEEDVKAATEQDARRHGRLAGHVITSVATDWVPVTNPPADGPAGQDYQPGDCVQAKSQGRELAGKITAARADAVGWIYTLDTGYGETEIYGGDVYYLHPAGSW
jgi:hypothetical protein